MKKGAAKPQVVEEAPPEPETHKEPEKPTFGFGKFEYRDQSSYIGNWKCLGGIKMKHGYGKAVYTGVHGKGNEEYEGDWVDDKMHGYGRYQFTSGGVYTGQWHEGQMQGQGKIVNADGTSYSGDWHGNRMHGEGLYIDFDGVKWEGIFNNGSYESKIQKKLRAEKEVANKVTKFENQAKEFL